MDHQEGRGGQRVVNNVESEEVKFREMGKGLLTQGFFQ